METLVYLPLMKKNMALSPVFSFSSLLSTLNMKNIQTVKKIFFLNEIIKNGQM